MSWTMRSEDVAHITWTEPPSNEFSNAIDQPQSKILLLIYLSRIPYIILPSTYDYTPNLPDLPIPMITLLTHRSPCAFANHTPMQHSKPMFNPLPLFLLICIPFHLVDEGTLLLVLHIPVVDDRQSTGADSGNLEPLAMGETW